MILRLWGMFWLSYSLDKLLSPFLNATLLMANSSLKDMTFSCSFSFAVLKRHASHCTRHMTNSDFIQSTWGIVHAVICSCKFYACFLEVLRWPCTNAQTKTWLKIPLFRLRSVKMEQRKLNDQANTLVDLAKVSRQLLLFCINIHPFQMKSS